MKTLRKHCKYLFTSFVAFLIFANITVAQKNGIFPLTGMKFFNEGIASGSIDL